jgi:hypothetical protein
MEGVFWWVAMGWVIWSSRSASDWMPPGTTAVTHSQTQVSFTTARHGKQVVFSFFSFFLEPLHPSLDQARRMEARGACRPEISQGALVRREPHWCEESLTQIFQWNHDNRSGPFTKMWRAMGLKS